MGIGEEQFRNLKAGDILRAFLEEGGVLFAATVIKSDGDALSTKHIEGHPTSRRLCFFEGEITNGMFERDKHLNHPNAEIVSK